jgi:hypothetical protein
MSPGALESPTSTDDLYDARGEDVQPYRPIFTGDVFEVVGEEAQGAWMVLQHPCALRRNGVDLVDSVLVAPVSPRSDLRSKMEKEKLYLFPLRDLRGPGNSEAADFASVTAIPSRLLNLDHRVAVLSQEGVNLLLQRWVHHNSRVVIHTDRFNTASLAEFEEADLAAEWAEARADAGEDVVSAQHSFHEWIRGPWTSEPNSDSRQVRLRVAAQQVAVRKAMRAHLKTLSEAA